MTRCRHLAETCRGGDKKSEAGVTSFSAPFSFPGSRISGTGAEAFAEALRHNSALKTLNLACMQPFGIQMHHYRKRHIWIGETEAQRFRNPGEVKVCRMFTGRFFFRKLQDTCNPVSNEFAMMFCSMFISRSPRYLFMRRIQSQLLFSMFFWIYFAPFCCCRRI